MKYCRIWTSMCIILSCTLCIGINTSNLSAYMLERKKSRCHIISLMQNGIYFHFYKCTTSKVVLCYIQQSLLYGQNHLSHWWQTSIKKWMKDSHLVSRYLNGEFPWRKCSVIDLSKYTNILTYQFLQGNVQLRHLLNEKTLFMSWPRSVNKEVNDWNLIDRF